MLMLLRHGKSDWNESGTDHQRPLAPRGVKASRRIGRFIANGDLAPQLTVSSTALRARSTAELVIEEGGFDCPLELTDALYEASVDDALGVIRAVPDNVSRLLVAGHEPTTSMLAATLIGGGRLRVVTATLVGLEVHLPWSRLAAGFAELRFLVPPRLL